MKAPALALAVLVALLIPVSAQNVTTTKLGSANTSNGAGSGGVNESGQVAITLTQSSGLPGAYFWTRTGGLHYLGDFGGGFSAAFAINNSGAIVGDSTLAGGTAHAFLWTQSAGMQDLGTLFSGGSSVARAVNDAGQVMGASSSSDGSISHGFFWSPSSGMVDIGTLGGNNSSPTSINNSGQIVGTSTLAPNDDNQFAFTWSQQNGITNLDPGSTFSYADQLNDNAQIVGSVDDTAHAGLYATLWTATAMQDLGTLSGDAYSQGLSINGAGHVAGRSWNQVQHTFFWTAKDGMTNVGAPNNSSPSALNDRDMLLVSGGTNNTTYLWSPSTGLQMIFSGQWNAVSSNFNNAGQFLAIKSKIAYLATPAMHATLTSAPNPSTAGQTVTLSATVTSIIGAPPDGEEVTFYSGAKSIGSASLQNGTATILTSTLPLGSDLLKAKYAGDDYYKSVASPIITQVVNP